LWEKNIGGAKKKKKEGKKRMLLLYEGKKGGKRRVVAVLVGWGRERGLGKKEKKGGKGRISPIRSLSNTKIGEGKNSSFVPLKKEKYEERRGSLGRNNHTYHWGREEETALSCNPQARHRGKYTQGGKRRRVCPLLLQLYEKRKREGLTIFSVSARGNAQGGAPMRGGGGRLTLYRKEGGRNGWSPLKKCGDVGAQSMERKEKKEGSDGNSMVPIHHRKKKKKGESRYPLSFDLVGGEKRKQGGVRAE